MDRAEFIAAELHKSTPLLRWDCFVGLHLKTAEGAVTSLTVDREAER